jgi:hypothetical protein
MDALGRVAYQTQNYIAAERIWRAGNVITWYDKDIPPYNSGTANYRMSQWDASVSQLERALKYAPESRQCRVRWNLALALNQRGDTRARSQQENAAVGDYTRAITLLEYKSCIEAAEFAAMRDVIAKKLESLIDRINQQHSRPQTPNDSQDNDDAAKDQDEAADRQKRQVEYRNSINSNRFNDQPDDEKTDSYQNKAW